MAAITELFLVCMAVETSFGQTGLVFDTVNGETEALSIAHNICSPLIKNAAVLCSHAPGFGVCNALFGTARWQLQHNGHRHRSPSELISEGCSGCADKQSESQEDVSSVMHLRDPPRAS